MIQLRETYIQKAVEPAQMTPEYVAERWGKGKYQIRLTDGNRPKGQQEVAKILYDLQDAEKPPVYDIRTLLIGHNENLDEVNRQISAGLLVRDASGVPRLRTASDAAGAAPEASNGHLGNNGSDFLDRNTMGAVLLKLVERGSTPPGQAVKESIELAKMLMPPPAPALDVEALIERVAARLAPQQSNGDGFAAALSTYERVSQFLGKANGGAAPAAAAGSPDSLIGWAPYLPGIITGVRQLIPEVVGAFNQFRGTAAGAAGASVPSAGVAAPAVVLTLEQRIEEIAGLGFQRMREGVNGFDFAAYICGFHPGGLEVYQFLERSGGAVGLMALLAMNPATRPMTADVAQRAQIEVFLSDFFSFDPLGASETAGDQSAVA